MLSIGIGLCINQTRAVFEALWGRDTEFVRTPKHGVKQRTESWIGLRYRAAKTLIPYFELIMAAYLLCAMLEALRGGHYLSTPFLLLFLVGFGYVGALSVYQRR